MKRVLYVGGVTSVQLHQSWLLLLLLLLLLRRRRPRTPPCACVICAKLQPLPLSLFRFRVQAYDLAQEVGLISFGSEVCVKCEPTALLENFRDEARRTLPCAVL